jgi:hypothetical protein
VPKEKKTRNCEHCGKEFIQARKDQKYCNPQCRFEHFFEKRDNEKARMEEDIETLRARVKELEARLQSATIPALMVAPKKPKAKAVAKD